MIVEKELQQTELAKAPTEPTIPIAEIFGPTIQGEGALAGRPTYFLRVGGCDYKCLWCDTDQAVLPENVKQLPRLTQEEIIQRLVLHAMENPGPNWLTISGGNPAMYDLSEVVRYWQPSGPAETGRVAVETQGSRWQDWFNAVDCLTISPKPPSSGMPISDGFDSLQTLRNFMEWVDIDRANPVLKVICFDEADYEFARQVHKTYPAVPFYLSTGTAMGGLSGRWVPPAIPDLGPYEVDLFRQQRSAPEVNWTSRSYVDEPGFLLRRYRWLVEKAAADPDMADAAIFPQLHVLLWGVTTKGV